MSADDFAAWLGSLKTSRGWTQRECAAALGVDAGQITRWKKQGAPRYIALATAAITEGLSPWTRP